jgi:hypothetical protein
MLEWPAYCALSLSFNKVIFNFAKDVGMYACLWHAYFVILMGLILYGKKLCYCLILKKLSLLKNCKPKRKINL